MKTAKPQEVPKTVARFIMLGKSVLTFLVKLIKPYICMIF